jgi:hypothetical protein
VFDQHKALPASRKPVKHTKRGIPAFLASFLQKGLLIPRRMIDPKGLLLEIEEQSKQKCSTLWQICEQTLCL